MAVLLSGEFTGLKLPTEAADIRYFWETGQPTEDALWLYGSGNLTLDYIRSKRSNNGLWHVKLNPVQQDELAGMSLEAANKVYEGELQLLAELGIGIIPHARAFFPDNKTLTLSPWIDGIEEANEEQLDHAVTPILNMYFREELEDQRHVLGLSGLYRVFDVHEGQFSSVRGGKSFLHDLDIAVQGWTAQ